MNGKETCRILKEIRRQIAECNDIAWIVEECTHKGDCAGTCPKCESEVRQLERALERRKALGKAVTIAGISAACLPVLSGCSILNPGPGEVAGMMTIETAPVETEEFELDGDVICTETAEPAGKISESSCPETESEIYELDGELPETNVD